MQANVRVRAPEGLILAGATLFIVVLAVAAWWEPDIRWLHFFQAWMYIAAAALSLRGSKWGLFVGISAAAFWNYASLFVNTFFVNGLEALAAWERTGQLARPDQAIAVPAWSANLLVLIGCGWAYARGPDRRLADVPAFVVAFAATTGFFAADMALFQPRYLSLFVRALHPHLP